MKLHLEIITPDRIAYSEEVDMVIVPGVMGTLGILPKHIPLFAQLTEGELKIKRGSEDFFLSIGGGFVEVTKTKVSILVTRAVNSQELNESEIIKAKTEAIEALKRKPEGQDLSLARAMLRQSLVDMKVLRRRRRTH